MRQTSARSSADLNSRHGKRQETSLNMPDFRRRTRSFLETIMPASNAIVVASAARTPVGSFNGSFATHAGARARHRGDQGSAGARRRRRQGSRRGHPRPGADRRPGPEPGAPGGDRRRPAEGNDGLGAQPGLRLGPARHRARHAADQERRRQDHRRRRPGIDVAVARIASICAPAPRWATSNSSTR